MLYHSTRNKTITASASQAILSGIASDGGLFIPETFPKLSVDLSELVNLSYQQIAFIVMKSFFTDFTDAELQSCIDGAYSSKKFDTPEIVPIHSIGNKHYLELFHGQTIAFKDMALSILPYLMTTAAKKLGSNKKILILTATSGDTGKAAMAGFSNVDNTKIIVFYPKNGVSHIQELQMVTQTGNNTHVVGITGNFDDAQSAVKKMFTDSAILKQIDEKGYQFSSANSINIGRLIPQVAYYVYAYAQLVKQSVIPLNEPMNISVPTGNFGNILAGFYAKQLGIPIKTFICASNKNNVLSDFFKTGTYDRNRPFYVTNSPSMDILISSNLERLLCHVLGNDTKKTAELMHHLANRGVFHFEQPFNDFFGDYATEQDIEKQIKKVFDQQHYMIDPHTAVSDVVYDRYQQQTQDTTPVVIAATASPYKFPRSVMQAFGNVDTTKDDLVLVDDLENLTQTPQPQAVLDIKQADILHNEVVSPDDMVSSVLNKL